LVLAQAHATEKTLSPTAVKALLQASAATVKIETACHCRIDVGAALGALQSNSVVVVPNAGTFDKSATHQFAGFGGTPPYTYVSSKPAVATISTTGMLTAVADGETAVTITDSQGKTAASRSLFVGKPATPPGNPGKCPLNPPALCDIFCKINPQLPWCSK
jgi:thermitase